MLQVPQFKQQYSDFLNKLKIYPKNILIKYHKSYLRHLKTCLTYPNTNFLIQVQNWGTFININKAKVSQYYNIFLFHACCYPRDSYILICMYLSWFPW